MRAANIPAPEALCAQTWDAIVVGSGMGGSAAAWYLASMGWSVLVLERGHDQRRNPHAIRGAMLNEPMTASAVARLADGGRDDQAMTLDDGHKRFPHRPFLGMGTGGSSALYGCALERFQEADFAPRSYHRDAPGCALPEVWPFSRRSLDPWYTAAERQLGVVGGEDLTTANRALVSPANAALADILASRGLRPRRLRLGDLGDGACGTTQGMLCPHGRKQDAANAFLYPAVDRHGAMVLDRCTVTALAADHARITGVVAEHQGRTLRFQARQVLLAGGAIHTPALLQASSSNDWPTGLANRSGWVGRGLMRHFIDLYSVALDPRLGPMGRKELSCNDWYSGAGFKLGSLQSFGPLPSPGALAAALTSAAREERRHLATWALGLGAPLVRMALGRAFAHHEILASIVEDLPYEDQQVRWSASQGIKIRYPLRPEAQRRIQTMRTQIGTTLSGLPIRRIPAAEDLRRLAHSCGTCRAGHDPATSVVDSWCRAHDLDNLHIVDASWLPSSGGTNPGLTIAANALRVASHLHTVSPPCSSSAGEHGQDSSAARSVPTGPDHGLVP